MATALPTIVGGLGDLDHIAWVFTAYLLTSTISVRLVGGFFVDHLSWRWVFDVNIPFGVVALLVTAKYLLCPGTLFVPGTLSGAEGRITGLPLADGDPLISPVVSVLQIDVSLAESRPSRCPARTKCGQEVLF